MCAAPHQSLMESIGRASIDPYLARFIERWLRTRRFSVRLDSPAVRHFSTYRPATRGRPQGGVLSPFLWLLHFDGLHEEVRREVERWMGSLSEVRVTDRYYADDITVALAHQIRRC